MGLGADPFEDFEAAFEGELEIEKDDGGEGIFFAIGERAVAGEIINGLLAVLDAVVMEQPLE